MVKKQYIKSNFRLFVRHLIRLLSITAIFIVSIGLMDGMGVVKYNVKNFVDNSYKTNNVYDLKVMGTFDQISKVYDTVNEYKEELSIVDAEYAFQYDVDDGEKYAKRYFFSNFDKYKINKLTLIDGKMPSLFEAGSANNELVVLEPSNEINKHQIGETVHIDIGIPFGDFKICGVVREPTILGKSKEPSTIYVDQEDPSKGMKYINDGFIINMSDDGLQHLATSLIITLKPSIRNMFDSISEIYKNEVDKIKIKLADKSGISESQIITLQECFSFNSLIKYSNKVGILAIIFIVFFSAITLLVVFSTMSRLLDEDRGSMAVLKTLGYSSFSISMRYVLFMGIAGLVGSILALAPALIVNNMIINGFMMQYKLFNLSSSIFGSVYFVCVGVVLLGSLLLTFISSINSASHKPIELLTPKAPKVGKKIFLENFKKFWNKLSFKYKSTCRNVFLFKGRFFMTFVSIISSTALVFTSLALFDNSFKMTLPGVSALRVISIVLLVFCALLCALVVYNITNINISERTREIATLMVLGYREKEITGYIYREIYIMAIMSAIVGLPTGIGFTAFVFNLMDLAPMGGDLSNINWWSYVLTPIFTFFFAFLSTLLLKRRILKTDMNESLKTLE